jgi:hypothetical protein
LEANAASFESHHGWGAPMTAVVFASAAGHGATSVTAANDEGSLENGRIDDDAFGFVDEVLRNVFRDVHNFLEDGAAVVETFCFFVVPLFAGQGEYEHCACEQRGYDALHSVHLVSDFFNH